MKRLISILVLVAMMLTSFTATISALADELTGEETETPVVETEKVYNVNWKELVEKGTMRSTWIGDRTSGQNNMSAKYDITATENALKLSQIGAGDSRAYFSEVMFDITADTQYEYVFKADKTNDNCADAGVIFAWAATTDMNGHEGKHAVDGADDIYPGLPKFAYHLMADWGAKKGYKVVLGGPDDKYAEFGTTSPSKADLSGANIKVDEENFATYKVVYNGLQVKMYALNTSDEWVEFFADKNMTLAGEAVKLAVGLNTWKPSHTNLKDCVITAKNEAAVAAMNAAFSADKTAFDAKLAEAAAFVEADWLPADWAKFAAKIDAAKAQAAAAEYKYEVDYAMAKIDSAVKTLNATATSIKGTLEAKIAEVDAIVAVPENQGLYTETSWGRMTAALEAAKTTVADAAATNAAMVAAYVALNGAKKGLLTKELVAKNTYNMNWKYFFENNMLRSQWWWDNSDDQNNYLALYKVTATENYLGSEPIKNGDNRAYYSTMMFDITENTYYEYTFEAKNDRQGGYAGVMFAYDTNDFPYFVYGQFDNRSDKTEEKNYDSADFRYRKGHDNRNTDGHNCVISADRHYPVLDLTTEGYGQFKYVYDGYNFSFYAKTEGELKLIWTYTLPEGSKVALGVYTRGGNLAERRTMSLQNAALVAYNEAAAEILVDTAAAKAIAVAEAKIAEGIYTPETVQAVKDAITALKNATAADVDAAIAALQTAILGLLTANKDALNAAIDAANAAIDGKTEADFEARYYAPFAAALATAIDVRDNLNADQDMVDEALAALEATFKYLTPAGEACKVDLADALAAHAALVENDYKPSSWATLADPLAAAQNLDAAELTSADQEAIDAAVVALNTAIANLVKRADFRKLQAAYDRAIALDADDYTNWADVAVDAAVANALAALGNLELDQADVDAALAALDTAVNALLTWRTNVLFINVEGYNYPSADAAHYEKITDKSYFGEGNVFYYDYHKFVAQQGITPGTRFEKTLGDGGYEMQGSGDHCLRLGSNISGSGTNRVTDGEKDGTNHGGLSHRSSRMWINGKVYGHVFGFSFLKAPTVDSIAVYLPTSTKIVSIDVYGAVRETLADGTVLYGKADKAAVVKDANDIQDESATTVKKVYLGTVVVPAAADGAANIYAAADFVQAMAVEYIYFAINFNESHGATEYYSMYEIELFGLNADEKINGNAAPNFTAVNAAFAAYWECVEADYTEESWAKVAAVIEQYADVINNIRAEQADVDAAAAAIKAAVDALEAKPADWTALDALITAGSAITADAYTPNTYNPFKAIYDEAVALRATANVPQTKVDSIVAKLTVVLEAVAKRAEKTALKAAYDDAKTLKEEEWNADKISWKMFTNAIATAEALLADDNATQADVDTATAAIAERKAALKKVEAPAGGDNEGNGDAGEAEGDADKDADAKDTQKATDTQKTTDTEAPAATEEKKGGCGSSVALSALAIVGVIGTAVIVKKKED